jgi:hypothetical protein
VPSAINQTHRHHPYAPYLVSQDAEQEPAKRPREERNGINGERTQQRCGAIAARKKMR